MRFWELDFDTRTAAELGADIALPDVAGRFRWLDSSAAELDPHALAGVVPGAPAGLDAAPLRELEIGDNWLAFGLTEPSVDSTTTDGINVLLADGVLVTLEFGTSATLAKLRQTWRDDFERFAQSPGFFLFELSDHYTTVAQRGVHSLEGNYSPLSAYS